MCTPLMKPLLKLVNNLLTTTATKFRSVSSVQYLKKVKLLRHSLLVTRSIGVRSTSLELVFLFTPLWHLCGSILPPKPSPKPDNCHCLCFSLSLFLSTHGWPIAPIAPSLKRLGSWSLLQLHLSQTTTHSYECTLGEYQRFESSLRQNTERVVFD